MIAVVCVAGCYNPSFKDCEVSCASGHGCPADLECKAGMCRLPGAGPTCGSPGDDASGDAIGIDAPPPDAPACWPILPTNYDPCDGTFPAGANAIALDSGTIDTVAGTFTSVTGGSIQICTSYTSTAGATSCLVRAPRFTVNAGANIIITGSLPLLVVADSDITVSGTLEVSNINNDTNCPGTGASGAVAGTTGSGGAGGSYGGAGAEGGTASGFAGGAAGAATGNTAIDPLRMGCPGGLGASGNAATVGRGLRGSGGGAIELSSKTSVVVTGRIHANGGGGGGGGNAGGITSAGGGGGAGGSVLLEAPIVNVANNSEVCAVGGGGGGGGGGTTMAGSGADGNGCNPGLGGQGGTGAGFGGAGGGATIPAARGGDAMNSASSAGGGGGSVGRIRFHAGTLMNVGTVVPAPVTN